MDRKGAPNRLRNINLLSIKEVVIKSAALTLLLSTIACQLTPDRIILSTACLGGFIIYIAGGLAIDKFVDKYNDRKDTKIE